jgi:arylsulfatase A-like enzyme
MTRARQVSWAIGGGAAVLVLAFLVDFVGLRLDFMGFSDAQATSRILREYGPDVVRDQLALLLVMAIAGASFGALGGALALLRGWQGDSRRGWLSWGACAAAVAHVLFVARHLVRYPQLYTEAFYDRGGGRRAFMLALTRHTSPRLFWWIGLLVIILVLGSDGRARVGAAAARGIRYLATYLAAMAPARRRVFGVTTAVLVVGALAAHALSPRPQRGPHPNVLLIAVDSLRADRVFGPDARRFPAIQALAAQSARFRGAHVTVPRTFPSFVTLLTGRYPHHHGIRHKFPSAAVRARVGPTLPGTVAAAGYRTAALSDYAGEIFARTPLGFDVVDAPRFEMHTIVALRGLQLHPSALPYAAGVAEALFPYVRALSDRADPSLLADRAIERLHDLADGAAHGRPFFETVFFSTPHFPYAAPFPYYQRYGDPLYEGRFLYEKPPLSPAAVGPADAAQIQALYDGAVAAVDDQLARLLRALHDTGADEDTIVVLLADHGENLWEDPRAGMGHGDHLIGERAVNVPLLIYDPRDPRGGARALVARDIDAIVRDIDLAPTLAALCGVSPPPTDGVDLSALLYGSTVDPQLPAFSETEYWFVPTGPGFSADERMPYPAVTGATDLAADGDVYMRPEIEPLVIAAKHRALRLGRWKLVYRPTRAGVSLQLFDETDDPDERDDVSTRYPERLALMRDRLYQWMLEDPSLVRRGDFVVPR